MPELDVKIARLEAGEEHIKDLLQLHVKRSEEIHHRAEESRKEVKQIMQELRTEINSVKNTVEAYENKGRGLLIAGTLFLTIIGGAAGAIGAKLSKVFSG